MKTAQSPPSPDNPGGQRSDVIDRKKRTFQFDDVPNRTGTDSLKWARYAGRDVLPLWVADMDFPAPPAVVEALRKRVDHGIFGYAVALPETYEAVCGWFEKRYGWPIQKEWIVWLPGLVCGLHIVCRAFAEAGEQAAVLTPVYPPFLSAPILSGRAVLPCPLQKTGGSYEIDFERLEQSVNSRTRILLFCHPHNPVGRVWTHDELMQLAELCLRKNLLLCSDEIHADLVLEPGCRHIPAASLSSEIARRSITLASPSKTFNLPGLNCAFAVIPNASLRNRFLHTLRGIVPHVGPLGYAACTAAYREGADWLEALLDYLRDNRDLLCQTINALPGLSVQPPQATYLAWIDCRGLGLPNPADFFEEAGVGLSDGAEFEGSGYVRLNFACPKSRLQEALRRMHKALSNHTF
ncbi:MAG TPA: PatB family C-S lyase [Anaerohalosphaeraceae bacterium]|nr:PatB family C-S lyase [Anaerohalosphaeraceae bacterium]HQG04932.1 PatB family C-S lyase [Anaerohalosphaeraceae bacterium]HQI07467.1 PatB family C-S lyase [Anaerohalosphaeraceae bacterium]HQJ67633.1 PatB family C-S lyase [Anaerohalosphaeraceae bacterium]